ncbi:GNAT family N-acetyltransferase [Ornithinimicrobium sp. F0845]|uniref:GNAT family N-acetyltransferase n=1 Tax=Ornithinimicrobium sp. F0845 TaxID=2926412 RepID=UPI001FF65FD1|nr:GNAT family N-acetyltransferase [Ornithinimicrobium sp. F0845]MCK0111452.1 GNAT family N-acetyltransferase [Ornithinimicrobium sp. F0845]
MRVVTWGAPPHEARAVRRPDGQWSLRLPEDPATWASLVATLPDGVAPALLSLDEGPAGALLSGLGFEAHRTEQLWEVPVGGLRSTIRSAHHDLVPVTECDLARVTALDNAIRAQIPGTGAWWGTVTELRDSLDDDEFDPELYLVAVDGGTGSYDGLIRVWNRRPLPRLGCVGVRPEWRRTRLGPALLGAAATTLAQRGVTHVVTETDVTNRDSHPLAARHGAVPRGRTVEWVLRAHPGQAGADSLD